MGSEQSSVSNRRGTTITISDLEPVKSNPQELKVSLQSTKKLENQLPASNYARLATQRPKLLPEVEDTIKQFRSSSSTLFNNQEISGEGKGTHVNATYEILEDQKTLPNNTHNLWKGYFYQGEWKNKKPNGKGVLRGPDGSYWEAVFINGIPQGHALQIFPDGSFYNGEIKDGKFNGKGKFFYKINKMHYEGEWKDGKPSGKGVELFPGIGKYEGHFLNGLKHGKGEMKWDDGREYEGEFADGYMHGEGVLKKNKGVYRGKFDKNNKVSGEMKTETGTYNGPFVRGEMSGRGKFTWYNGNVYEGDFKFNKMHGNGKMTLKGQQSYSGQWENGVNVSITE